MERRVSKVEGRSSISGRYTVEDFRNYLEPDMWYRQLIFKGSETHVVSEIRLKNGKEIQCSLETKPLFLLSNVSCSQ